ncbi:MAG TPA: hypothetical protein VFZ23_14365 [Pyrinomonadaceae bacterium]
MKRVIGKISSSVAVVVLVTSLQVLAFGQEKGDIRSIEGVWQTVVTPRICATGAPVGPTFPGILSFDGGGTITGTSTAVTSTYGLWVRAAAPHKYSFSAISLKYDAAGNSVGSRRIDQEVTLDFGGNGFTSTGGFQDFDLAGNPTISGCSTSVGTRFRL